MVGQRGYCRICTVIKVVKPLTLQYSSFYVGVQKLGLSTQSRAVELVLRRQKVVSTFSIMVSGDEFLGCNLMQDKAIFNMGLSV